MDQVMEAQDDTLGGTAPVVRITGRSYTLGKLAAALSKAQGEMQPAAKSTENTFLKSKYADLAAVWDACRGPLSKYGIAVIQLPRPPIRLSDGLYETRAIVETLLAHESDEWISAEVSLPVLGPELKGGGRGEVNAQSFGSAITYARRYGLAAMAGVVQDDDDGSESSGTAPSMADDVLAAHLKAISEAKDEESLKNAYIPAYQAAIRDQPTQARLIAAKDARKKQLEAKKAEASK